MFFVMSCIKYSTHLFCSRKNVEKDRSDQRTQDAPDVWQSEQTTFFVSLLAHYLLPFIPSNLFSSQERRSVHVQDLLLE